jgi:hypothetical protein
MKATKKIVEKKNYIEFIRWNELTRTVNPEENSVDITKVIYLLL